MTPDVMLTGPRSAPAEVLEERILDFDLWGVFRNRNSVRLGLGPKVKVEVGESSG